MEENIYDIIIIGGGVAGLSFANSMKNTNLKILLLERKPKYIDVNRGDTLFPHTIDILEKWSVLANLLSKGAVQSQNLCLYQNDKKSIDINIVEKAIAKNKYLLSLDHVLIEESLYESLQSSSNVTVLLGANVSEFVEDIQGYKSVKYKHEGKDCIASSNLFISADGRDSIMRKKYNIEYDTKDFKHDILILTSSRPKDYNNQTWFLYGKKHEMIIGLLPHERIRISLILRDEDTTAFMKMNDEQITELIRSESTLLDTCSVTKNESHIYEIKSSIASKFHHNNLILLGDCAHTIHPVSGQGMSLAVSDAEELSNLISALGKGNLDMNNSLKICKSYDNKRRDYVVQREEKINKLGNLLISENSVVDLARIFLVDLIDAVPLFEKQIAEMVQSEIAKF